MPCDFSTEKALLNQNYNFICGVDEVGRGAVFGPVVAGAVILNPSDLPDGLNDSKLLSAQKRQLFSRLIYQKAPAFSIGWCWNDEIDDINILEATKKAMKMAIKGLQIKPDYVLMDGMKPDFIDIDGLGVIKGDTKCISIAAASIIAKVFRDQLITSFADYFPTYGLEKHKGYFTRIHAEAVDANGLTSFHRKSFKIGRA